MFAFWTTLFVVISAALYRIPRGGPSPEKWHEWFGFDGFGSTGGRLLWAIPTGTGFVLLAGLDWYWAIIVPSYLWGAVALKGWGQWWANDGDPDDDWQDIGWLTLRGLPLLNPFMGLIYHTCWEYRDKLPRIGVVVQGWTAWAEIFSGAVTACALVLIAAFL